MSEPENFLARWSRLKREAPDEHTPQADESAPPARDATVGDAVAPVEGAVPDANAAPPPPAFDPASLPSIESITAATDIRPFLAPGVPASLTRAALRRAWTSDPNIRDFIEMAENQWDFANPDSIPGFAPFQRGEDVSKFIAELGSKAEELLEKPWQEDQPAGELADARPPGPISAPAQAQGDPYRRSEQGRENGILQGEEDYAAMQHKTTDKDYAALPTRRRGGGALPQ